jgi:AraC-like DNA-binding protein
MIQAVGSVLPSIPLLTHLVEEIRVVRPVVGRSLERVERLPDGTAGLLFRMIEGDAASTARRGDLIVAGLRTQALHKLVPSIPLALCVRLRPGAAFPILGVPADELTDRIIRLEEVWGSEGTHLLDRLLSARGVDEKLELFQRALYVRAIRTGEPSSAPIARRALRIMTESPTPIRINELASVIGVSVRHLRRTFTGLVGVGPKEFSRIIRFQRAAARAAASGTNWAKIAVDAGYYDQAHMIGEFRALVGTTPEGFVRRESSHRW